MNPDGPDNTKKQLPVAAPAAFSLPNQIRSSGFSWTEILAFLSLQDVVKFLSLFRHAYSTPVGFFPTGRHRGALLASALRSKIRQGASRLERQAYANMIAGSLELQHEVTVDELRNFAIMLKALPPEVETGDPRRKALSIDRSTCCITGCARWDLVLLVDCTECAEQEEFFDRPPEPCGTFVFAQCPVCKDSRDECSACGSACASCHNHVCKKCLLPAGDEFCRDCGYTCTGCNLVRGINVNGHRLCDGPNGDAPCLSGVGARCDTCSDGYSYCDGCSRDLCALCGTVNRCDGCEVDYCTSCRAVSVCFGCNRGECTRCLGNDERHTCDRCSAVFCDDCSDMTMQFCGRCDTQACLFCEAAPYQTCTCCDADFCPTCGVLPCSSCGSVCCDACYHLVGDGGGPPLRRCLRCDAAAAPVLAMVAEGSGDEAMATHLQAETAKQVGARMHTCTHTDAHTRTHRCTRTHIYIHIPPPGPLPHPHLGHPAGGGQGEASAHRLGDQAPDPARAVRSRSACPLPPGDDRPRQGGRDTSRRGGLAACVQRNRSRGDEAHLHALPLDRPVPHTTRPLVLSGR